MTKLLKVSAALATIVVVALVWRLNIAAEVATPVDLTLQRESVAESIGPFRPVEARFVGGFRHADFASGNVSMSSAVRMSLLRLRPANQQLSEPDALANLAILQLINNRSDQAIAGLEELVARFPRRESFLNDLAVAYMARAERSGRSLDNLFAFALLDRAVTYGYRSSEVLFNYALVLERLYLSPEAIAAWNRFLQVEGDPEWAAEASQRLKNLEEVEARAEWGSKRSALESAAKRGEQQQVRALVGSTPQPARHLGEEEALAEWAKAVQEGDDGRGSAPLEFARAIGSAIADLTGDRLLSESVAGILAAKPRTMRLLAQGFESYAAGRALSAKGDYTNGAKRLTAAHDELLQAGSAFSLRAQYALGVCDYYRSRRDRALKAFAIVESEAEKNAYWSLQGEALWMKGLSHFSVREVEPAREAYEKALIAFQKTRETENIAGGHILLSELYDHEGDIDKAWRHRLAALQAVQASEDPQRRYQIYSVSAIAASKLDLPRAALYFQEQAARNARKLKNPLAWIQSSFWKSKYLLSLRMDDQASAEIEKAAQDLSSLSESVTKDRAKADVLLIQGKLLANRSPRRAVSTLTEAINLYGKGDYKTNLLELLNLRAQEYRGLGELDSSEQDLREAIHMTEVWRSQISAAYEKSLFSDQSRRVFDAMIAFQLEERRDSLRAFEYLEEERAKNVLERWRSNWGALNSSSQSIETVISSLPKGTVLVSYTIIDNVLFVFVVDRFGVRFARPVSDHWKAIESLVYAFRAGLEGHASSSELRTLSTDLYNALIRPFMSAISSVDHLVISADGALHTLPYAALLNEKSGKYLIQEHLLSMTPSARFYMQCRERYKKLSTDTPRSILLVSDPHFDAARFSELSRIVGSNVESSSILALYPESMWLGEREASVGNFVRSLNRADVLHFADHAVMNSENDGKVALVFAVNNSGEPGLLQAEEISRLALNNVRLVVMAACDSMKGGISHTEGVASLAQAFLAAGAPSVIGSLWEVRDGKTTEFMVDLHTGLRSGVDPSTALRNAQLKVIERNSHDEWKNLRLWSSFQMIGG
jgi:CHAT domain-containing protein